MDFDDYQKWQDDLLRTMRGPLHEADRLKELHDSLTRPFKQFEALMGSPFQQEIKRYEEQQKLVALQGFEWIEDGNVG